ncbi:signal recognition particle-docking protein FtsY [Desulfofustis glycolicus]|uniref:Signal recognition particle receptor FtsY n=1 Tax=Desulfofustis glycolicus DSM 9705 TaxID=1121409 RepID=A0A1M5XMH1_9BACT|nr:signal recognition particle-docking protein FtsY [Desulfofustis glycolicus]SHI00946.1 signal recognition particle-docking protein FtsY [Desulfofustis glycolicus DSM 9705]
MLGWFRKKKKSPFPDSPEDDASRQQPADAPGEEPDATIEEPEITDPAVAQTAPPTKPPAAVVPPEKPEKSSPSIFKKLSERLARTRESFTQRIDELFLGKKQIDAALFDELEEILVTADLGIATTMELLETARRQVKRDNLSDPQQLKHIIKDALKSYLTATNRPAELVMPQQGPFVMMVVGVNGVGKTTTIGKIGAKFHAAGRSVLLVAADTFRAAAISQLKIWGERNDARVIAQHEGADPSSVVFDAMAMAVSKGYDVVLIDTAGRLHTRANLMDELKKIKRVITKQLPDAPHEVLLVIDATTGQNGISQATLFNEAIGVTGIALTKLDGTAKGGIVANITRELQLPIRFIGVGEKIDDLRDFDADEFIEALFATESDDDHSSDQLHTSES